MRIAKVLSLILVLALMLSVGAFAADVTWKDYQDYLIEAAGGNAPDLDEFKGQVEAIGSWDEMPLDQSPWDQFFTTLGLSTWDEFVEAGGVGKQSAVSGSMGGASGEASSGEPSGEVSDEITRKDFQDWIVTILPVIDTVVDKLGEIVESTDVLDGIDLASGLLGEIIGDASGEGGYSFEGEEDYSLEPPQCVLDLSEEDDILLNGELKNGVYVNEYFGIKLTLPEGGTIVRENDDATESTEIIPLRQTYEDGWGCLYFSAEAEELDGYIHFSVQTLMDDEIGLSEEELVRKNIDSMWEINALFGDEGGPILSTVVLAGEEHPVAVETGEYEGVENFTATFDIPKGDFEYHIYMYSSNLELEDLAAWFTKP